MTPGKASYHVLSEIIAGFPRHGDAAIIELQNRYAAGESVTQIMTSWYEAKLAAKARRVVATASALPTTGIDFGRAMVADFLDDVDFVIGGGNSRTRRR